MESSSKTPVSNFYLRNFKSWFYFFKNQENFSDSNSSFDLDTFSKIPVLRGGRVKPLDSVARNILLVLRNKRTALKVVENDELKIINDIKNKKVLKKTLTEDEIAQNHNYYVSIYSL